MGFACVDLRSGAAVENFLGVLNRAVGDEADAEALEVWVGDHEGRSRLSLFADRGNIWLGQLLAHVASATGDVERAVVGLDHDEFGIENAVLDGRGGQFGRVHHVYVYPNGEPDDECVSELVDLPVRAGLETQPGGTVDGPGSRAAAAALFNVPTDRMEQAARQAANAHEGLGEVFTPFEPWWDALGARYPIPDLGPATVTLDGGHY
jgi:hypothetical protein